ncbi:MAG: DNA mismatch repair protein MutS [Bacteroidales bacterium]|nr:DNA mismatch repair protein MutS [Bacteroidales bacterium]
MQQYYRIKKKHPNAILLFRVGDFYETFGEDAIKASEILGITLTKRANGSASYVDLAGIPYHAIDTYLPKLVRAGQRVAICEQLEDPSKAKKIVKRGVTEMVTPGVSLDDNVLENKENNFLASVHLEKNIGGVAFLDISTGEFLTAEGNYEYIDKLLNSFQPKEVLFERGKEKLFREKFGDRFYTYKLDDWVYTEENATDRLLKHFNTTTLKGFGVSNLPYGIIAAGSVLQYLEITQHENLKHISSLSRIEEEHYVWLDKFTIRNLELFHPVNEEARTLIDVIDRTVSPMGGRLLRRWVALPLKEIQSIRERQSIVEYILQNPEFRELLESQLQKMGDVERIVSKVAAGRVTPREMLQLKNALYALESVRDACRDADSDPLKKIGEQLNPCHSIREKIEKQVNPEAPTNIHKGNIINQGVSDELDELRDIAHSSRDYLKQLQQRESERTGIPSLKVSYNSVFGYYIEVRNTHKDKVPGDWTRKQTLVNAERYITEELKDYETKILGAEEKSMELEAQLFNQLVVNVADYISAVQLNAHLVARLDCLLSFAKIADENQYCKPEIQDSEVIDITQGRHPVIEKQLPIDEEYVANDVYLDNEDQQIMILTGPNMAGKSALLRQTALIVLLAQIGSYVPAKSSKIGVVDKIFTRVGASDNISMGESTFMVEMHEAASILNNLSSRSLLLLDEIGRGTSTYDGISIAWAMAEYIHEHPKTRAKTLFATHYHEMNEMEKSFSRIKNYNITVKELDDKVIFIRKLKRGGSEHSFGIHVARMAGMPKSVVSRANEILKDLENSENKGTVTKPVGEIADNRAGLQTTIFQLDDPVLKQIRDEIKNIDINNLTPVEALNKLNEIKRYIGMK